MPEPLEFQIIQNLQTALRGISIANGYHHNVAVLAVKLDANHDVESLIGEQALRPFVILELLADSYDYFPAQQVRLRLPFIVHAVNDTDPTLDDAQLKTYLRLAADIERAIALDSTRGGLATDTRILSRRMRELAAQQVWTIVEGEISEHRKYGAPDG